MKHSAAQAVLGLRAPRRLRKEIYMRIDTIKRIEEKTFEEPDTNDTPPADIIAYNELRSCADLYRMKLQGDLDLNPEFQRSLVWPGTDQTRFIDSLIKQLPIPSMCFGLDYKTQKWIVIDGLQRISTIVRFLDGGDWVLAELSDVTPAIQGKSVAALKQKHSDLHAFYKRVENLSIPITVLRCDFSKESHMEYLFTIFHRLNSGGKKLNNQEIRNCIFQGTFNDLLKELDLFLPWRKLNNMKKGDSERFKKQELILRFFAFYDGYEKYTGGLSKFLNSYMNNHRKAQEKFLTSKRTIFKETVCILVEKIFKNSNSTQRISITLIEALLVGISRNLDACKNKSSEELIACFENLKKSTSFSEEFIREGLSSKQKVTSRLSEAEKIFKSK
ncbi:MAG: DUF262 domain-containing protein [Proteobacteria bacterium]|nr:DUF262 domain-containing protein [Pseudomonadota bacterium]